tara:strand:+ start:5827 stop:5973 length:147 start_codon:yes stop_codon:yes gene_type:complete
VDDIFKYSDRLKPVIGEYEDSGKSEEVGNVETREIWLLKKKQLKLTMD